MTDDNKKRDIAIILIVFIVTLVFFIYIIPTPTKTPTLTSEIKITYPSNSSSVDMQETITGTAENIPEGQKLWILVYPLLAYKFYPQNPNVNIINGEWSMTIGIGAKDNGGETFKIIAVLADQEANGEFTSYINTGISTGSWPGMGSIPEGAKVVNEVTVTRRVNSPSIPIVNITSPLNTVKLSDTITGTSKNITNGQTVWVLIYPHTANKYYPQNEVDNENWNLQAQFGGDKDVGNRFDVIAVMADQSAQNELQAYYDSCIKTGSWPGLLNLPNSARELDRVTVTRV